jgi:hypothetical protein
MVAHVDPDPNTSCGSSVGVAGSSRVAMDETAD